MTHGIARIATIAAVGALIAFGCGAPAHATGYWNVPGTCCQWFGCGFGGGYHAPLVLGPPTHECFSGPNEIRLPCAPNPYACAPGNCGGAQCGCNAGGQTMMPESQPTPEPQPATPHSAMFAAPVQR